MENKYIPGEWEQAACYDKKEGTLYLYFPKLYAPNPEVYHLGVIHKHGEEAKDWFFMKDKRYPVKASSLSIDTNLILGFIKDQDRYICIGKHGRLKTERDLQMTGELNPQVSRNDGG